MATGPTSLTNIEWATGCGRCQYGVRNEHYRPPTGAVELLLERLVNAERVGPSYFCECRAGTALRANLVRVRAQYGEMVMRLGPHKDGKGDQTMIEHLEIGKVIIAQARTTMDLPQFQFGESLTVRIDPTPTVRFVGDSA